MWFIERLLDLLRFPVEIFWKSFEKYKDTKSIGRIILLFLGSLSGLIVIGGSFVWIICYLISYHFELVLLIGAIIWLYAYVKSKMNKKYEERDNLSVDVTYAEMQAQAEKAYPIMRNIIFQTIKETAVDIGGVTPRLLQEIEIANQHYMLVNGICYYQFQLSKADPKTQYLLADLSEFRAQLQMVCSRLIHAGRFSTLKIQDYMDAHGNWYDAVSIDIIEDIGNTYIIQTVFTTPEYTELLYQNKLNQNNNISNSVPDASWK